MSRFPAELTVTLTDGHAYTECFNQAPMAHFMRERMLELLQRGEPITVFDGETVSIDAKRVESVHVAEHALVTT